MKLGTNCVYFTKDNIEEIRKKAPKESKNLSDIELEAAILAAKNADGTDYDELVGAKLFKLKLHLNKITENKKKIEANKDKIGKATVTISNDKTYSSKFTISSDTSTLYIHEDSAQARETLTDEQTGINGVIKLTNNQRIKEIKAGGNGSTAARADINNNINPNAKGIITSKNQVADTAVRSENVEKITEEDEDAIIAAMERDINNIKIILEDTNSPYNKVIFPREIIGDMSEKVAMALASLLTDKLGIEVAEIIPKRPNSKKYKILLAKPKNKETQKEKEKKDKIKSEKKAQLEEAKESLNKERPTEVTASVDDNDVSTLVRTFPNINERKARVDFISNKFSINLSEYIDSVVEYLSSLPASEMRFPCMDTDLTNQEVLEGLTKGDDSARRLFALNYLKGNEVPNEDGEFENLSTSNLVDKIFNDMYNGLELIGSLNAEDPDDVEAVAEMLLDDTEPLGRTFLDEAYQKNWGYIDNNGRPTKNLVKNARKRAIHLIQSFAKMKDLEVFKSLIEETKFDLEINEGIVITGSLVSKTKEDIDNEELNEESLNLGKMDFITKYRLVNPKDTLSKRVKTLLNSLVKVTKDKHGNIITEYDDLGQPVKLNSAVVYYILLDKMSNMIDEADFDKKLLEMSKFYPWMNAILERITPMEGKENLFDWDLRKEFYRAMNKTFVQFAFISANGNLVNCNMKNSSEVVYDIANKNYEGGNTLSRYSIYDSSGLLQEKNINRLKGLLIDNKKNSEKSKKEFTEEYQKEHKSLLWAFQTLKNAFSNKRRNTPEKIIENIKEALLILRAEHPNSKYNNISLEELIKSLGIDTYNINMDAMLPVIDTTSIDYKIDPKTEDIYVPSVDINENTGEEIETKIPVFTKDMSYRVQKILSNAIDILSRVTEGVPVIYNNKRSYLEIGTALTIVSDSYTQASFRFGNTNRFSYVVPSFIDNLCNSITNEDSEAAKDFIDKHYGGYDFYQNRVTGTYNSAWLRMMTDYSKTAEILRRNFRVLQILGFGGSNEKSTIQNLSKERLLEGAIDLFFSANKIGDINFGFYLNPLYSDVDARSAFQFRRWTAHNEINDDGILVKNFDFKAKIISELVNSFKQDLNRVRAVRAGNNQEDIEFFNSGKKQGSKLCFFPEFNTPFTVTLDGTVVKFNGIEDLLEYTKRQDDEEAIERTEREDTLITALLTERLAQLSEEFINSINPRYKQKLFNRMKKRAGMEVQEFKSSDDESLFDDENKEPSISVEIYGRYWTRDEITKQEDKVFLFGDNTEDRESGYVPSSTQAVIRGLPNAIGIDTKKNRGTSEDSYFTDDDFEEFKERVDSAIQEALDTGKVIVLPKDGIGTGEAQLKERAPKLFEYLESQLEALKENSSIIEDNIIVEANKFLEEFYYNNFLAKNQLIQILGGDLALYKNFTDFIKRNKQCFAGGERLYSKDEEGNIIYEYSLYLEDLERASNTINNISNLLDQDTKLNEDEKAVIRGAFYNITTTDGQSLRSLTSFKKLLTAMGGKWTDKMTEAYNRLKSGEVSVEDFNVLWQPIKPFLFSYETRMVNGRREKIYTQHKNSEYLLSAMYTLLNTALNTSPLLIGINKFLEENNIDAVHFHSTVKEGYNNGINLNYSPDNFIKNIVIREEKNGKRYFIRVGDILIEIDDVNSLTNSLKNGEISYREYKESLDNMYERFMKEITNALRNKEITSDDYNKVVESIEFSNEKEVYEVLQKLTAITDDEIELLNDPESGYTSPSTDISPKMVHGFPISDYMIMQPTDDHLTDAVAKFGSQLRNIIYADLDTTFTRTITLGDKSKILNREEAIKFYNYLITSQLVKSFSKISDEFTNAKSIEDMLQRKMKLQPSKYPPEIRKALTLDNNGNFQLPFNSPNLRNKIEDLILSEFKNHIQKQSIKGGNAVLVSNFGLHKDLKVQYKEIEVNGEKKKVVDYIPVYMTHTMASQLKDFCVQKGNIMQLDFDLIEKKLGKDVADDLCKAIGYRI